MSTDENLFYQYHFKLDDGRELTYRLELHPETLSPVSPLPDNPPEWTTLAFKRCSACSHESSKVCPVAVRLAEPLELFKNVKSIEKAWISIQTPERIYMKHTDVQSGLGSLFGLIMATSGCGALNRFKPMARFHLPFSSILETVYRFASMVMLEDYFKKRTSKTFQFESQAIKDFYAPVAQVNQCMVDRLRTAVEADSALNAVVLLDCFTSLVPDSFEYGLKELETLFNKT